MATDTLNPNFDLASGASILDLGIRQLIDKVEYESADGMADVAKIHLANPNFILTDAKAMQIGNELSIFMGYGTKLEHIGRVVIVKQEPVYPENGMPTMTITGYTKDAKMMENAPEKSKTERGKHGRVYSDSSFADAVQAICDTYGMNADIDPTPGTPRNFNQKVGLSDYDFVKGLSNIVGFVFWVDGDAAGNWTLHFKNPETMVTQQLEYTFKYNLGDMSSLLSFKPQLLLQGQQTKIKVQTKDTRTGALLETEIEEDNAEAPEITADGDPTGTIKAPHTTGSAIKLFIEDFSFDVITNRRFKTTAEVQLWARQWFRRNRENFVLASGKTIGIEKMFARQSHSIEGVSVGLDGRYYFSKVKHTMSKDDGYTCEFNARRTVPAI